MYQSPVMLNAVSRCANPHLHTLRHTPAGVVNGASRRMHFILTPCILATVVCGCNAVPSRSTHWTSLDRHSKDSRSLNPLHRSESDFNLDTAQFADDSQRQRSDSHGAENAPLDRAEKGAPSPNRPSNTLAPDSKADDFVGPSLLIWNPAELFGDVVKNSTAASDTLAAEAEALTMPLKDNRSVGSSQSDHHESLDDMPKQVNQATGEPVDLHQPVERRERLAMSACLTPRAECDDESPVAPRPKLRQGTPNERAVADGEPVSRVASEYVAIDDRTDDVPRTMEHLLEMLRRKNREDALRLRNPMICRQVRGFGDLEPFPSTRFVAGSDILVYCEVENYAVSPQLINAQPSHRGRFSGGLVVLDSIGEVVDQRDFAPVDDCVKSNERSFVIFPTKIPALNPGSYRLVLIVTDELGNKFAATDTPIDFAIVPARPTADGRM